MKENNVLSSSQRWISSIALQLSSAIPIYGWATFGRKVYGEKLKASRLYILNEEKKELNTLIY